MMNLKSANEKLTKCLSNNIIIVYLIFLFLIFTLPFLFTRYSILNLGIKANEIGDAINGLTAPIIGTFSALLLYLAFKSQTTANKLQSSNFDFQAAIFLSKEIKSQSNKLIRNNKEYFISDFYVMFFNKLPKYYSDDIIHTLDYPYWIETIDIENVKNITEEITTYFSYIIDSNLQKRDKLFFLKRYDKLILLDFTNVMINENDKKNEKVLELIHLHEENFNPLKSLLIELKNKL